MWLSTKGRYALRSMLELALHGTTGKFVPATEISKNQEITSQYIEQLMVKLKRAGLVESTRGPAGGYRLTKKPAEITTGEIIRTLEGYIEPVFCVNPEVSHKECHRSPECAARLLWKKVGEKVSEILDSTTLEDLVKMDNDLKLGIGN
ncbi:MAG: RrF2 family transcriptional regulator [bacterium]